MIFKEGLYLGLLFCVASISACSFSRIFFAIAVPSILVAVMVNGVLEKCRDAEGCRVFQDGDNVNKVVWCLWKVGVVASADR